MSYEFRWNAWNIEHIGEHNIAPAEAEFVVNRAKAPYPQHRGDGRWLVIGPQIPKEAQMKKPRKTFTEMTVQELREATKEFDNEFVADTFGPPTAKASAALERAKRRGRPTVGKGAARVLVTIERGLLHEADAFAKDHEMSRSELIAAGLNRMIGNRHRKRTA